MITFITENSRYQIDDTETHYMRTALRNETGIEAYAGPRLIFGEWLPLKRWKVERTQHGVILRLWGTDPDVKFGIMTSPIVDWHLSEF